jgi:hypothetical protein
VYSMSGGLAVQLLKDDPGLCFTQPVVVLIRRHNSMAQREWRERPIFGISSRTRKIEEWVDSSDEKLSSCRSL